MNDMTCKTCGMVSDNPKKFTFATHTTKDGIKRVYRKNQCNACTYKKYIKKYKDKRTLRRYEVINKIKDVPCADCGVKYPPYVMDFDHRDSSEKLFNVGTFSSRNMELVMNEIAKCDVVCANCHRERTHGSR